MTLFWFICVLLVGAAVAFVAWPLWRGPKAISTDLAELNLAIRRDQLKELETDRDSGVLSSEQYEQGLVELERDLLAEVDASSAADTSTAPVQSKKVAVLLAVAIPVLAVFLYMKLGTPAGLQPGMAPAQEEEASHELSMDQLADMVQTLADRLSAQPDNPDGWMMLGRSYSVLRQFDMAAKAYATARDLIGDHPDVLTSYADALAMANEGGFTPESLALIARALEVDPSHPKALWLSGTVAYDQKDYPRALDLWQRLVLLVPPGSEQEASIQANIAEVRMLMGDAAPAVAGASPAAGSISGQVQVAPFLMERVNGSATLFIYAKATQGPPMPLAIIRKTAADLPLSFTLDETMAMMPEMSLARFPEVMVGARISASGNATATAGDLQGLVGPVAVGTEGLTITIDEVVQ